MRTCASALIYTVRQQKGKFYRKDGEWMIQWPRNIAPGLRKLVQRHKTDILVQLDVERAYASRERR